MREWIGNAAIRACTTIIDHGAAETPRNRAIAHYDRGFHYGNLGDKDRALAEYNEAIRTDPLYAPPYNSRGNIFRDRGDGASAFVDYNEAIRLESDDG